MTWGVTTQAYRVAWAKSPIRVDGVLDEEAWKEAVRLDPALRANPSS